GRGTANAWGGGELADIALDIFLGDSTARAASCHLPQIDAQLACQTPRRRPSRHHLGRLRRRRRFRRGCRRWLGLGGWAWLGIACRGFRFRRRPCRDLCLSLFAFFFPWLGRLLAAPLRLLGLGLLFFFLWLGRLLVAPLRLLGLP